MCAKDRSQIIVYSQSEFIDHLDDLLSVSSSHSFIRDSQGELIYLSPLFERSLLNGGELKFWFSSIPIDIRLELFNAELNSLSGLGPYIFKNVKSISCLLNIFIECVLVDETKFVRWVFIPEPTILLPIEHEHSLASKEIDDIFCLRKQVDSKFWSVFNLYAYGFTISSISRATNLTEDQVKKVIRKIKNDCFVNNRDCLMLLVLKTLNYSRLSFNVMKILTEKC
ncbi:hypothetical protein [Klebsiella oxytoca]|uniref:hypothetical protein n=1 Tax=Klebsiella oxytoca TaxID=571 RepID=UPI0034D2FD0D